MKRTFFSWLGLVGLITVVLPCHAQNKEVESLYHKVERFSLAQLEWEDEDWSETTYYEYLKRCLAYQRNPQEFKKRRSAFRLLCSLEATRDHIPSTVLADTTTWTDLNLFSGDRDPAACLVDKINRSHTQLGRALLCCMLAQPNTKITELQKRQQIIQELINNPSLCDALDAALERSARTENYMLSFWLQDQLGQAAKRHYFNVAGFESFNNLLNKNEAALGVGMLWEYNLLLTNACTCALAAVVLPVYALSRALDKKLPERVEKFGEKLRRGGAITALTAYVLSRVGSLKVIRAGENGEIMGDGLLYGMGIKSNFEWVRDNIMLDVLLQEKLIDVAAYIEALHDIEAIVRTSDTLTHALSLVGDLHHVVHELPQQSEDVAQLFELLKTDTFTGTASLVAHKGRVLAAYRLVPMVKDKLAPAFAALAELDVYVGIAKLMKEFQHKRVSYSFANFKQNATPYISLKDFWNPFVDVAKVVPNTIILDGSNNQANGILTGPNAGGKSTILKAIALNLILGQTFGVCPAAAATITPFSSIATYLNIADDIASGNSLFKAEVLRAQALVKKVESLQDGEFSFVAIDEMFSGTSPHEGRAAAYSVAKHLGKFKNNMSIIATHFPLLTNLANDTSYFTNYKVTVHVAPDGTITYPFKLEQGISNQHVAIDILKAEGFDNQILTDALNLIRNG
ncbi:MAG: hypothetical protein ACHQVS_02995 [Candidatus Babeliales bacterium]